MCIKKDYKVGVITKPIGKAGIYPLSNLVDVLTDLSSQIYLITGNEGLNLPKELNKKVTILKLKEKERTNIFKKIIKNVHLQLNIAYKIIKLNKEVDVWIFFLDSHALILPVLIAKLLSKKIVFLMAASIKKSAKSQKDPLAFFLVISELITIKLCNKLILYSPTLIKTWNLSRYQDKIEIAHRHFLNFKEFQIKQKIDDRDNLVGFIGRLSYEKGILQFLESVKRFSPNSKIKFLIIGDGPLKTEVAVFIKENQLKNTSFLGWIGHENLSSYLNQMKLLIIPSYSEGLPNIMIEAMGCGTPILASKVGCIPDFITDLENGFIMHNNSPDCIERTIIRALNYPHLKNISLNAFEFAKIEFERENVINRWKTILELIDD